MRRDVLPMTYIYSYVWQMSALPERVFNPGHSFSDSSPSHDMIRGYTHT